MGQIVRLGPGECSAIETGGRYFAALAFPGAKERDRRDDAALALAASALHEANRQDDDLSPFLDRRYNELVQLDPHWCRKQIRVIKRRLRDRGIAARAVRPWVRQLLGLEQNAIEGVRKLNQRQIALFMSGGDEERADNLAKRELRPSRPVLHIAVAQDFWMSVHGVTESCGLDLLSTEFERLVGLSQQFEALIAPDPRFKLRQEDLLRLQWVS